MPFPPIDKSFEGVMKELTARLGLVERRLTKVGTGGGGGSLVFPAGLVMSWAGPPGSVPTGWVACDGREYSRQSFSALFAAIGTTYGVGDGSTTFNVPNGQGRVIVGQDGTQAEFNIRGGVGGAKTHTLTIAEMPAHSHTQANTNGQAGAGHETASTTSPGYDYTPPTPTANTGGGGAHNNLQPYIVQNWIISTGTGVGVGDGGSGGDGGSTSAPWRGTTVQRDTAYPLPMTDAEKAALANKVITWFNTDKGWTEIYYATTGTPGLTARGLKAGVASDWYPAAGQPIYATVMRTLNAGGVTGNGVWIVYDKVVTSRAFTFASPLDKLTPPFAGDYEISASAVVMQSSNAYFDLWLRINGVTQRAETGTVFPHASHYSRATISPFIVSVPLGHNIQMMVSSSTPATIVANTPTLTVRYVGPSLA